MKRLILILTFTITCTYSFGQTIIVKWDFEEQTTSPAEGEGDMELIGNVVEASTPFPQGSGGSGTYAYNSTGYPSQGTDSGTAGFQFNLSTLDHENISVAFAVRGSNTASKWAEFQFSTDGGEVWYTLQDNEGLFNNGWQGTYDLSLPEEVDNLSEFSFRIVTIFAPGTQEYEAIGGNNYSTSGTLRIDDVIFYSEETTATEDFLNEKIIFYPNPAKDVLYFDLPEGTDLELKIYDIMGNEIITKKRISHTVDISWMKDGIYIMKLVMGNTVNTHKLIVE